jgi:teichoic acid transport system permease protein
MKKFFADIKKFKGYVAYATRAELKAEVAGSFLSWVWWILDPLLYMLVYSFIAILVFRSGEPYFPVFVFIGLNCWQFFAKSVKASVKLVASKRAVVTKVYIPKHLLVLEKLGVYAFKMLVSFGLTVIFMIAYRVPVNFNVLWVIPLLLLLFTVTYAVCLFLMHFGVIIEDLANIINVVLQLGFYVSCIFYSIENRISGYSVLLAKILVNVNPLALIITDMRTALMGSGEIHYIALAVWFLVATAVVWVATNVIYKYENSYVKIA